MDKKLDQITEMLAKVLEVQTEHTHILNEHTRILNDHTTRLNRIEETLGYLKVKTAEHDHDIHILKKKA